MTECLIVGGGLAGSALGILLAEAGREVTLVEREAAAHDKVCGEFLSYEAVRYLTRLGIGLPPLGAVPLDTVRFAFGSKLAEARLPFAAQSLSRRILDEALLMRAERAGVKVVRGVGVTHLTNQTMSSRDLIAGPSPAARLDPVVEPRDDIHGKWTATLSTGETLTAGVAFLATGKHDLRGWKREPGRQNDLVAFKMHFRLEPAQAEALGNAVELLTYPHGYAGLQPVEGGLANLCLLVTHARLAEAGGKWPGLLDALQQASPHLATRLRGAAPAWDKPLAIGYIPYGLVSHDETGPWRLGDQAAVIPSFSGDGMSIALHSAFVAAEAYLSGAGQAAYVHRFARDVQRQVAFATAASRLLVRVGGHIPAAATSVAPLILRGMASATRIHESALAG